MNNSSNVKDNDTSQELINMKDIQSTPKVAELDQNHDSNISKVSVFTDSILPQKSTLPQPTTGNGRGRPRKN